MKSLFRFIKAVVLTLLAIGIVIACGIYAVTLLLEPNQYKATITDSLSKTIHQKVAINGNINWQLFPNIGLHVTNTEILDSKDPSKRIAKVDDMAFSVRLLPLFKRNIDIQSLTLKGLTLNLVTDKVGHSNLEFDYSNDSNNQVDNTATSAPAKTSNISQDSQLSLHIEKLDIQDANISWQNLKTNQTYKLENLSLTSGNISPGKEFPVELKFTFAQNNDRALTLSAQSKVFFSPERIRLDALNFTGSIKDTNLFASPQTVTVKADKLLFERNAAVVIKALHLLHNDLNLSIDGSLWSKSDKQSSLTIDVAKFNLSEYLSSYLPLKDVINKRALRTASLNTVVTSNKDMVEVSTFNLLFDKSNLEARARYQFPANKQDQLDFKISVNEINFDQYLSQKTSPNSTAKPVNQVKREENPTSTSTTYQSPKFLRDTDVYGQIAIKRLKFNQVVLGNLNAKIKNNKDTLSIAPVTALAYEGKIENAIVVKHGQKVPTVSIKQTATQINVRDLARSMHDAADISGMLNLNANLQGQGSTLAEVKKTLSGQVGFSLNKGVLHGVDIGFFWHQAMSFINGKPNRLPNNHQTNIAELNGNFLVKDGIAYNDDLTLYNNALVVTGKGSIGLKNNTINYQLYASEVKSISESGGHKKISKGDITVPIHCKGKLDAPQCGPDMAALQQQFLKKKGNKLVDKLLGNALDGKDDNEKQAIKKGVNQLLEGLLN